MTKLCTFRGTSCAASVRESQTIFLVHMKILMVKEIFWLLNCFLEFKNFKFMFVQLHFSFRGYFVKTDNVLKISMAF